MNRSKFLSMLGLPVIGAFLFAAKGKPNETVLTDCNNPITPPVPEGPYYKDEKLNRINITEKKKGVPIKYIFRVEDKHCKPIEGAIVDIWQCDNEGHYSDFKKENTLNETWLRGYQKTNKQGLCEFVSIFPGWYDNRITHLHAKVHLNGQTLLTTNVFFKKEIEDKVYKHPLYPKGPNPLSILQDFELKVDHDNKRHDALIMDVVSNAKGELTGKYTVALG